MKAQYTAIAALLSAVIIDEIAALREIEVNGGIGSDFQREKMRNLHNARATVEAIGAGYAGADSDDKDNDSDVRVSADNSEDDPLAEVMEGILARMIKEGVSVKKINLDAIIGTPLTDKKPPAENKAERAAYEAAKRNETSGE